MSLRKTKEVRKSVFLSGLAKKPRFSC